MRTTKKQRDDWRRLAEPCAPVSPDNKAVLDLVLDIDEMLADKTAMAADLEALLRVAERVALVKAGKACDCAGCHARRTLDTLNMRLGSAKGEAVKVRDMVVWNEEYIGSLSKNCVMKIVRAASGEYDMDGLSDGNWCKQSYGHAQSCIGERFRRLRDGECYLISDGRLIDVEVPDSANWLAMDDDGEVCWFARRPKLKQTCWSPDPPAVDEWDVPDCKPYVPLDQWRKSLACIYRKANQ